MVTIRCTPYAIEMQGHAGAGEKGKDLVCAGVSALAYMLALQVAAMEDGGQLADAPVIRLESGAVEIRCRPVQDYAQAALMLFGAVERMCRALEQQHPENVKVI